MIRAVHLMAHHAELLTNSVLAQTELMTRLSDLRAQIDGTRDIWMPCSRTSSKGKSLLRSGT